MQELINIFLHIDEKLIEVIDRFGAFSYILLFLVIFMETGLVVTPFLPGDSLLFAAGTIAAAGSFDILTLYIVLLAAAILGDTVNYWVGRYLGPKAYKLNSRLIKEEYIKRAQSFYDKHGGKTIILARFIPIIRTFAPFVAGIGKMEYKKFLFYNFLGGFLWVSVFLFLGYFFGNIPFIKDNFHFAVIIIILVSIIPILYEYVKSRREKKG